MSKIIRPEVKLQYLNSVSEGRRLELSTEFDSKVHIVATILADESDESFWLEVEVSGSLVQVPLELMKQAVELTATEVHSEHWYEINGYSSKQE